MSPNDNIVSMARTKDLSIREKMPGIIFDVPTLTKEIADNTYILSSLQTLDASLISYSLTVNTTATLLVPAEKAIRGYWLINPSIIVGASATGSFGVPAGAQTTNGNTQASPVGVANYRDLHVWLEVTAVSGTNPTLTIYEQSQDPVVTADWADTQALFTNISATGTYYANPGSFGLGINNAIRWVLGGTNPSFTFSVNYALKDGLPGSPSGTSKAVFFGTSPNITTSTGFPLMESQKEKIYLRTDAELWAIATVSSTINIFEMGRIYVER